MIDTKPNLVCKAWMRVGGQSMSRSPEDASDIRAAFPLGDLLVFANFRDPREKRPAKRA